MIFVFVYARGLLPSVADFESCGHQNITDRQNITGEQFDDNQLSLVRTQNFLIQEQLGDSLDPELEEFHFQNVEEHTADPPAGHVPAGSHEENPLSRVC